MRESFQLFDVDDLMGPSVSSCPPDPVDCPKRKDMLQEVDNYLLSFTTHLTLGQQRSC